MRVVVVFREVLETRVAVIEIAELEDVVFEEDVVEVVDVLDDIDGSVPPQFGVLYVVDQVGVYKNAVVVPDWETVIV